MSQFTVFAVRPYHQEIRNRVFGALESIGAVFKDEWVVPKGTPDDFVIQRLDSAQPDVILCPFNVHQDFNGAYVNGFSVMERFLREYSVLKSVPILMPVVESSMLALSKLLSETQLDNQKHILVVQKDKYESEELARYFLEHLAKYGHGSELAEA